MEALLQEDTAASITENRVREIENGDLSAYFPSSASLPMQEVQDYVLGNTDPEAFLNVSNDLVSAFMRAGGCLPDRPLSAGDIIHICQVRYDGTRKMMRVLDVLVLGMNEKLGCFEGRARKIKIPGVRVIALRVKGNKTSFTKTLR